MNTREFVMPIDQGLAGISRRNTEYAMATNTACRIQRPRQRVRVQVLQHPVTRDQRVFGIARGRIIIDPVRGIFQMLGNQPRKTEGTRSSSHPRRRRIERLL